MSSKMHVVKKGDTLWGISRHHGLDIAKLIEINSLQGRRKHALQIGQIIRLPDPALPEPDTELSLRILDLSFRPVRRAKLKLEYDDKSEEVVGDDQGEVGPIHVDDHAKGIRIYFRELNGTYGLIADHRTLPLGRKRLTLTSRKMLVRGSYMYQQGAQRQASIEVQRGIKKTNAEPHILPGQGSSRSSANEGPSRSVASKAPKRTKASEPGLLDQALKTTLDAIDEASEMAGDAWDWLADKFARETTTNASRTPSAGGVASSNTPPISVVRQTRVEGGQPTQAIGAIFAEENLKLLPANEKYRKIIISVAKRHGMAPQALAAVINAEAAKVPGTGEWKADSRASTSSAAGLTQFLDASFLELATDKRSMVNQKLKRENGYEQVNAAYAKNKSGARYLDYIYGKAGDKKTKIVRDDVLSLRFDPEYSIDAGAVYALKNLETMSKLGIDSSGLSSEDLAKLMYLAHHEGAGGAIKVVKGTLSEKRAADLLPKQVPGKSRREALLGRFGNSHKKAYIHWLNSYTDSMINVRDFMVNPGESTPRTMAEIAIAVNGVEPAKPAPKVAAQGVQARVSVPAAGAASSALSATGWRNPLDLNRIRVAGLASWRSATFGMVRNGGTRAHQGVDLIALPGTAVYAVANGKVVSVYKGFADTAGFGASIVLCVDVEDLPKTMKEFYLSKRPNDSVVYFAYCHLSKIDVDVGKDGTAAVAMNAKLGETGQSGNARGMNTIAKGAHLHFEARYQHPLPRGRTGLNYRVDPRPFLIGVGDPS